MGPGGGFFGDGQGSAAVAEKLPYFPFYPGDWRKDAALARCSLEAKGVWMDMLCLMFESEERGVLASGGTPWTDDEICFAVGGDFARTSACLRELFSKGVAKKNDAGAYFCRRIVNDEHIRQVRSAAGFKGGKKSGKTRRSKTRSKTEANAKQIPEYEYDNTPESLPLGKDERGQVLEVFAHYRSHHPKSFPKPLSDSKEWKLIRARLREGFSVDDLRRAIDGNHASPFHCGENEGGRKYNSLELIVRDGSKVTAFIDQLEQSGAPVLSEKTRRSLRAADDFVREFGGNDDGF